MPIYYTTSASCRPNNAIVIGGVNTAAKRRIQRKALHSCRKVRQPDPDCMSQCCKPNCATVWPKCVDAGCCVPYRLTEQQCASCTEDSTCTPAPAPTPLT